MVRRSIFMPPRSRAGADASAHVGHAPRLFGRRGGAGVMEDKNKIAGHENKGNQSNIEKLAKYIGKKEKFRICDVPLKLLIPRNICRESQLMPYRT